MIEDARNEIAPATRAGQIDLRAWIDDCEGLVVPVDDEIQRSLEADVLQFFVPETFAAGKNVADPYVIAVAKAYGAEVPTVVVSEELRRDGATVKKSIPSICRQLGVPCISAWRIVDEEGRRL